MKIRCFPILFLVIIISSIHFAQTLSPGDGIRILFYNIADPISGDYFVQKDESLMLPYLGRINLLNKGYDSVKKEIITKYSSLYRNPEISILPLLKVNILGEVRTPGFYYVTGIEKLSDLIAKAGGLTSDADVDDIFITRNDKKIEIDGQKIIDSGSKINDIGLQSGDGIYISRRWFSGNTSTILISSIAAVTTIIAAIIYTNRR
jgi:polysaccharide export outer membrane protein